MVSSKYLLKSIVLSSTDRDNVLPSKLRSNALILFCNTASALSLSSSFWSISACKPSNNSPTKVSAADRSVATLFIFDCNVVSAAL